MSFVELVMCVYAKNAIKNMLVLQKTFLKTIAAATQVFFFFEIAYSSSCNLSLE